MKQKNEIERIFIIRFGKRMIPLLFTLPLFYQGIYKIPTLSSTWLNINPSTIQLMSPHGMYKGKIMNMTQENISNQPKIRLELHRLEDHCSGIFCNSILPMYDISTICIELVREEDDRWLVRYEIPMRIYPSFYSGIIYIQKT